MSRDWRARSWRTRCGNFQRIGKVTTAILRCCWKPSWMPAVFVEPAIVRPTGSMWDRPPGAVAWIGSTRLTAKPSKTSTSIRWPVTPSSGYAAGLHGKQTQKIYREPKGKIVRKTFKYRLYPTRQQTEALLAQRSEACRLYNAAHQERVSNAPQIYQLLRPSGTVDRNSQSRRPRSSQRPLCSRCAAALRESIQGVFSTHPARTEARVSSLQIVSSLRSHHFPQPR